MFRNIDNLLVDESDKIILTTAIKQVVAYRNSTIRVFAESLQEKNEKGISESWSLNKLNKVLDGDMHLTRKRRRIILQGIRQWNPENHIFNQTVKDIFGIDDIGQLAFWILFLIYAFRGV